MIALIIIIIAAIFAFVTLANKMLTNQSQQPKPHSIHFDLLDDNGEPIPTKPVVRQLQYFCVKDKGYHVSVWPKDNRIGENIEFDIAGMSYRGNLDKYLGENSGTLEAEPTNPYDANAIRILADDGHHVGYVPKDMTDKIRCHAQLPCKCFFYIGENGGSYFSDCYIKI